MKPNRVLIATGLGLLALVTTVQAATVSVSAVDCVPKEANAVVTAQADELPQDGTVRLYFRRMNEVMEDFYYVQMQANEDGGGGGFWATFPKPEDVTNPETDLQSATDPATAWAEWWQAKEASTNRNPNGDLDQNEIDMRSSVGKLISRAWMAGMSAADLQTWLQGLQNEPVEFYVAAFDADGNQVAVTPMRVVQVTEDCKVDLTREQKKYAENLTVGNTDEWQHDRKPFHWLCDGIDNRIDIDGTEHGDGVCVAAVILPQHKVLIPAAIVSGAVVTGVIVNDKEPKQASPDGP